VSFLLAIRGDRKRERQRSDSPCHPVLWCEPGEERDDAIHAPERTGVRAPISKVAAEEAVQLTVLTRDGCVPLVQ
jgi:hypothetical protein